MRSNSRTNVFDMHMPSPALHTAYGIQHTAYGIQHTAYGIQHTAYSIDPTYVLSSYVPNDSLALEPSAGYNASL